MNKKEKSDNDIRSEAASSDNDLFQRRLELQSKVIKQMISKMDSDIVENENAKSEVKTMNVLKDDETKTAYTE